MHANSSTSFDVTVVLGGDFNRSATVTFPNDNMQVVIRQFAVGRDAQGYMRMRTVIDGNIPALPADAKLTVQDYTEEFSRSAKGRLRCMTSAILLKL